MDVVAGVADDGDVRVRSRCLQSPQKAGAADTAGQYHDSHGHSVSAAEGTVGRGPRGSGRVLRGAGAQDAAVSRAAGVQWGAACIGISVRPGK